MSFRDLSLLVVNSSTAGDERFATRCCSDPRRAADDRGHGQVRQRLQERAAGKRIFPESYQNWIRIFK